uniref:Beta-1,4-galactosyltransferase n=1 Tax=Anser cygnoides TaxID=8845 RepID=A0A8B9IG55_ANSCY
VLKSTPKEPQTLFPYGQPKEKACHRFVFNCTLTGNTFIQGDHLSNTRQLCLCSREPTPGKREDSGCPSDNLLFFFFLSLLTVGPLIISFRVLPSERMIIKKNPFVQSGGLYRPPHCLARYKSAILVAYSNQEKYLHHLLYYIHPFLQRQQLSYRIYLIQQVGNGTFNRAKLLNIGVREALKDEDWDCLLLHDVDLVPENDYNLYVCDEYYPKHMASAIDKFHYNLPYKSFFGGVSALTPEHYMKMNGFPNTYWGSGGENDDIATRTQVDISCKHHLCSLSNCSYSSFFRPASRHNTGKTWKDDGMNSLEFKLLSRTKHPLYTNITVDIGYVPPFS